MVSISGMTVSIKTDLWFPITGQQGHGSRNIQQELCRLGNEFLRLREQSGRLEEENRSLREILKKIGEMAGEA